MRLKRDDFIEKGFTDGCPGCKAILSGGPVRGHTEKCRKRMEGLMQQTTEGQERIKRQVDKENEYITQRLAASDEEARKKQKRDSPNKHNEIDEYILQRMSPKKSQVLFWI